MKNSCQAFIQIIRNFGIIQQSELLYYIGCKIDKELTEFSLTHIIPYNIIKANISLIKEVT